MRVFLPVVLCCLLAGTAAAQRGGGGGSHGGGGGGGGFRGGGGGGGFHGGGFSGGGSRGGFGGGGFRGGFAGGGFRGGVFDRNGFGRFGFRGFGVGFYGGYWPYYDPFWDAGYAYDWPGYYQYPDYGYGYGAPANYGGYASSPNVTVVYPSNATTPVYERPTPVTREYDEYGQEVHRSSVNPNASPVYLVAFKDHSIAAAAAYWVDGRTLHYVNLQHEEKQTSLDTVDRDFSLQLNRERHIAFQLPQ